MIVEGVLLFCDTALFQMLDAHIWIEADRDTCALRRHNRGKKTKHTDFAESRQWYEQHTWPRFEKYRTVQLTHARDALVLDGALDLADIAKAAAGHIEELLKRGLDEADRFAIGRREHPRSAPPPAQAQEATAPQATAPQEATAPPAHQPPPAQAQEATEWGVLSHPKVALGRRLANSTSRWASWSFPSRGTAI